MRTYRQYIEGPFGQIHLHIWGDLTTADHVFVCLAPSPYSGKSYKTIAPHLAEKYPVIAVDYPGYGQSDPVDGQPSIRDFANVAAAVIQNFVPTKKVILIGFHTGCLVAAETSLLGLNNVDRNILIDAPFFTDEKLVGLKKAKVGQLELSRELDCLSPAWGLSVQRAGAHIHIERAFDNFVDQVSSGVNGGDAFSAAFEYDCNGQFAKVDKKTFVIATQAGLYEESCRAARAIPGAKLVEVTSIPASVLEKEAAQTAKYVLRCLD